MFSPEPLRRRPVEISLLLIRLGGYATLVFLVWFPDPYQQMLGGTRL